jgi:hypothetical protein
MLNILVLYYATTYPIRATIWDHLYAFRRHSGQRCFYWNMAFGKIPWFIKAVPFDLVIFDTIFLWYRADFERILPNAAPVKQLSAIKVALPQDEFFQTDRLCAFINDFGIDAVFSVMPPDTWEAIYPTVDRQKVRFYQALTGYLEEETLERIQRLAAENAPRTIDVGYRAVHSPYFLGRHGRLKVEVAEVFQEHAPAHQLATDISTDEKDTFLGDDWYRFLLRCKYTIGVEGGSSVLDHDGSIRQKVRAYLSEHPQASFEQVETVCFPGIDRLQMAAISPRQLEACATRTCQILVEGEYNGILQAGKHYIALRSDFSNIEDVLATLAQAELETEENVREAMVEQAYQDIVASGQYTYRSFVRWLIDQSLAGKPPSTAGDSFWTRAVFRWMGFTDRLNWRLLALYTSALRPLLAPEMRQRIRRLLKR